MNTMKRLLLILLALGALCTTAIPAQTTQPVIVKSGTLSGLGQSVLVGGIGAQSTCSVTSTGTWSGVLAFTVQDPQQLSSHAIIGAAPDGSQSAVAVNTNITGWVFPCGGALWFKVAFSSYTSGSAVIQVAATTAHAITITVPAATPGPTPTP